MALTANRTGIGLCALAATGCVALAPRGRPVGPVALAMIVAAAASALILHGDLARAGDGARLLALLPAALVVAAALWPAAHTKRVGAAAGRRSSASPRSGHDRCGARRPRIAVRRRSSHGRVGIWRAALHTARERPVQGFGAGTFLAATRERQLRERPVPTRFAHDLALQEWVEVGIGGLLAVLAWYVAVATTLVREIGPPTPNAAAWLLAPAVAAFPLANLLDWPWALDGAGGAVGAGRRRPAGGGATRRPHARPPSGHATVVLQRRASAAPVGAAGGAWVLPPEPVPPPAPPPPPEAAEATAAAEQPGEAARGGRRRRVDLRRRDRRRSGFSFPGRRRVSPGWMAPALAVAVRLIFEWLIVLTRTRLPSLSLT